MIVDAKVAREGKLYVITMTGLGVTQAVSPSRIAHMIQDYCETTGVGDIDALKIDFTDLYPDECCLIMASSLYQHCFDHPNPFDCPDQVVVKWYPGPYGLVIHDGGESFLEIDFCPWCGTSLPNPDKAGSAMDSPVRLVSASTPRSQALTSGPARSSSSGDS